MRLTFYFNTASLFLMTMHVFVATVTATKADLFEITTDTEPQMTTSYVEVCEDYDTTACEIMADSRPNLCEESAVAETACKRFCGYCRKLHFFILITI